ncbi:unnamed protein product, partial [Darwinula stevensoni]
MILHLSFSYLSLFLLAFGLPGQECPPEDIWPCTCVRDSYTQINVYCKNASSGEEIASALKKASWPFMPLWAFYLHGNKAVKELPEGVFGNISFQHIHMDDTGLERIHPSAILSSKNHLERLVVWNSPSFTEFPFHVLPVLRRLKDLLLFRCSLTSVPAVKNPSLIELTFQFNRISRIEEHGWDTPYLRKFIISDNILTEFPHSIIKSLERLEEFHCGACHLGPTLTAGKLEFQSKYLKLVRLWENSLTRFEPEAII